MSAFTTSTVVDSAGKMSITGKDEQRKPKRLGRSPSRADTLMLTVAAALEHLEVPVMVG